MKTRGTVFPGWLNALFLLSMIAGGIIVSCKTTELPTETPRNEADGDSAAGLSAVEPATVPLEKENPAEEETGPARTTSSSATATTTRASAGSSGRTTA